MKLFFDTTVLVDLDRRREEAIQLLEHATRGDHELWISATSVSEIFAGVHLRPDADKAAERAREALGQFQWMELDGEVAIATGQVLAYQLAHGRRVEFQDAAIAASSLVATADRLVTDNVDHFRTVPGLEERVVDVRQALTQLRAG